MKLFISQPMNGFSEEDILTERKYAIEELLKNHDYYRLPNEFEVIDSVLKNCDEGPVWCLGESIKLMQKADMVIFLPGWFNARGCQIEHKVCERYNIPYMEI